MSLNPDKNVRLYYSIKEVSEMLDVNITTLRFWEKEFPQLKPKVTAAKVRQYSEKDIALLRTIRSLVKVSLAGRAGVSGRGWFYFKARSLAPCVSQAGAKPWLSVQSLLTNGAISRTRAHTSVRFPRRIPRISPACRLSPRRTPVPSSRFSHPLAQGTPRFPAALSRYIQCF